MKRFQKKVSKTSSVSEEEPISAPTISLRDLRGVFRGHEKSVRQAIRELEAEHRQEAEADRRPQS